MTPEEQSFARSVLVDHADELKSAITDLQPAPAADTGQAVKLTYTNWRGETSGRTIVPLSIWYGSTDWHPEPQWLIKAIDMEKGAERDFALKDFGHPAPLDAERVREAATFLLSEIDAQNSDEHVAAALDKLRAALRHPQPRMKEGE
jgi:predicted DNA-binding transcriptional regulator YafY